MPKKAPWQLSWCGLLTFVVHYHGSFSQVGGEDPEKPGRNMHVMEVFNHHLMGHTIEGFAKINKGNSYCMRIFEVQELMNKLKKLE